MTKTIETIDTFPFQIRPVYANPGKSDALEQHIDHIKSILLKNIPDDVLHKDKQDFLEWVDENLPQVFWSKVQTTPDSLCITLFCQPSKTSKLETFFYDIVKRWLIPEKELTILSFSHLHFYLDEVESKNFFLGELHVLVKQNRDLKIIEQNLPLLAKEIISGSHSSKYAKYILETKALSYDQKMALTHQDLIKLLQKKPNDFDTGIFTEISRFLALTTPEFRTQRPYRHITRIACSLYLIRKNLRRAVITFPEKRHLSVRFVQTELEFPFGKKPVLGLLLGVYLFHQQEFFEERHIIAAVQKFFPETESVKGSFYIYPNTQDTVRTLYLEVEKNDGKRFSLEEIQLLKKALADELKGRIEHLTPSVFMIRNEEETMRNILTLSQQLKYISDLPHVMISFDRQTTQSLIFTVILVRVCKRRDKPVAELLQSYDPKLQFIEDRSQIIGYLRKKYPKEANVFHLQIDKEAAYQREDSSLNLYLARQTIVFILTQAFGEIRDYNGGMIVKQDELFSEFKRYFKDISRKSRDLLENFFFNLNPIEVQATLSLTDLIKLFEMFLKGHEAELITKDSYYIDTREDENNLYLVLCANNSSFKTSIEKAIFEFKTQAKGLVSTLVEYRETVGLAFLFDCEDPFLRRRFIDAIQSGIVDWLDMLDSLQLLRLNVPFEPVSLDPRIGGDGDSGFFLKMLFDGLMRIEPDGKPSPAIAESYKVSKDLKKYTFFLRECYWSNGSKVTAFDFEYSWKTTLSPNFTTPFAYMFYEIKNAQAVKEGKLPMEELGITVVDDLTLAVELEYPTPYFLELLNHTIFSPVNHLLDKIHPQWSSQDGDAYICNGPFKLKKYIPSHSFELEKNPQYWDADRVDLDELIVSKCNDMTAMEMFQKGETDWLGRPMRAWKPFFSKTRGGIREIGGMDIVFWYVFNTERFPFHNKKIRKAFGAAIDRKKATETLGLESMPAHSVLPLALSQHEPTLSESGDVDLALQLFEEGLKELNIEKEDFPLITLICISRDVLEKISQDIKEKWESTFGIQCRVELFEWSEIFDKVTHGDYQIGAVNWRSWVNDPIYTLNSFKYPNEKINFSNWGSPEYQKILDQAVREVDQKKRMQLLANAEEILSDEMPATPIFYEAQQALKKEELNLHFNPTTGGIDFKYASFQKKLKNR